MLAAMSQLDSPATACDTRDNSRERKAQFPIFPPVSRLKKLIFQTAAEEGTQDLQTIAPPTPAATSSSPAQSIPSANGNSGYNGISGTESWTTTIDLSAQSGNLVCFHRNLYYGLHTKIKCPDVAARVWAQDIQKRLSLDLIPAQERVSRKKKNSAVELDLRMSGTAQFGAETITLAPTIWILCGSQYCKKTIEKEVTKLTWLRIYSYAIEIHKGAPILAASLQPMSVPLEMLDLGHPFPLPSSSSDNLRLHIHLEDDETSIRSACGRLCCFTLLHNNLEPVQRFSRLGGMMDVATNGQTTTHGLTTAHGIFQLLDIGQAKLGVSLEASHVESDVDSDSENESAVSEGDGFNSRPRDDDTDDSHSCCSSDSSLSSVPTPKRLNFLGYRDPRSVKNWVPIMSTGPINFLGRGTLGMRSQSMEWWSEPHTDTRESLFLTRGGDFALLTIPRSASLRNAYEKGGKGRGSFPEIVRQFVECEDSDSGVVQILADAGDPIEGRLLPNAADIRFGEDNIQTRKIELSAPLCRLPSTGFGNSKLARLTPLFHQPQEHLGRGWSVETTCTESLSPSMSASHMRT